MSSEIKVTYKGVEGTWNGDATEPKVTVAAGKAKAADGTELISGSPTDVAKGVQRALGLVVTEVNGRKAWKGLDGQRVIPAGPSKNHNGNGAGATSGAAAIKVLLSTLSDGQRQIYSDSLPETKLAILAGLKARAKATAEKATAEKAAAATKAAMQDPLFAQFLTPVTAEKPTAEKPLTKAEKAKQAKAEKPLTKAEKAKQAKAEKAATK